MSALARIAAMAMRRVLWASSSSRLQSQVLSEEGFYGRVTSG